MNYGRAAEDIGAGAASGAAAIPSAEHSLRSHEHDHFRLRGNNSDEVDIREHWLWSCQTFHRVWKMRPEPNIVAMRMRTARVRKWIELHNLCWTNSRASRS